MVRLLAKYILVKLWVITFCISIISLHAAEVVNYSGRLVQSSGAPVTGNVDLTVKVFENTTERCSVAFTNVSLSNGVFNLAIDFEDQCNAGTENLSDVIQTASGADLTIEITDVTNTVAYPKQPLNAVPFALTALTTTPAANSISFTGLNTDGSCDHTQNQYLFYNAAGQFICRTLTPGGVTSLTAGTGIDLSASTGAITVGLSAGGVSATELASDAVTTVKILDANVTTAKIADSNVTTAKIADNNVTNAKIVSMDASKLTGTAAAIDGSNITNISNTVCTGTQYLAGDGTCITPTDNDTTYTAGAGLDLTGTVFSIDAQGVTNSMLAGIGANCANGEILKTNGLGSFYCSTIGLGSHVATQNLDLDIYRLVGNGGTEGLAIDNSGNVGIGTDSPLQRLHVYQATGDAAFVVETDGNNGAYLITDGVKTVDGTVGAIRFDNNGDSVAGIFARRSGADDAADIQFFTQSTNAGGNLERMRITKDGNVGIGTTNPTRNLEIFDATDHVDLRIQTNRVNGQAQAMFVNDAQSYNVGVSTTDEFYIYDGTNTTRRFTITNSGNTGIGTNTPTEKLTVAGNINVTTGNDFCIDGAGCLSSAISGAGEINTASSLGGTSLVGTKSGVDLQFRGLTSSSDITITQNANDVNIAVNTSNGANQLLKLDGSGALPAIDGSNLTGLTDNDTTYTAGSGLDLTGTVFSIPAQGIDDLKLSGISTSCANGEVLKTNGLGAFYCGTDIDTKNTIDTTTSLGTSNTVVPSQNAVKSYVDSAISGVNASQWTTSGSDIYYSAGDVGVGSTNPASKLHVYDGTQKGIVTIDGNGGSVLKFHNGGAARAEIDYTNSSGLMTIDSRYQGIVFKTGTSGTSSEAVRIDETGRVGIGTTAPAHDLHIVETADSQATIRLQSNRSGVGASTSVIDFMASSSPATANKKHFQLMNVNTATENYMSLGSNNDSMSSFTKLFNVTHSGRVGIGTTTPQRPLHLLGTTGTKVKVEATDDSWAGVEVTNTNGHLVTLEAADSGVTYGGSVGTNSAHDFAIRTSNVPRVYVEAAGNVGIGTATPSMRLDVNGSMQAVSGSGTTQTNMITARNSTNNAYTTLGGAGSASAVSTWNDGSQYLEFVPVNATSGNGIISTYTGNLKFQTNTRQDRMVITSGGNVGIGTTSPDAILDVTSAGPIVYLTDNNNLISDVGLSGGISIRDSANAPVGQMGFLSSSNNDMDFINHTTTGHIDFKTNGADRLHISNTGNVGIGTTTPAGVLDVNGDICLGGVCRTTWPSGGGGSGAFTDTGSLAYYNGGKVGIGTATPQAKLHIENGADASFTSTDHGLTVGVQTGVNLAMDGNELIARNNGVASALHLQTGGGAFYIHNNLTTDKKFLVDDDGKVGIGTVTPSEKLEVAGSIKTIAGYGQFEHSSNQLRVRDTADSQWWSLNADSAILGIRDITNNKTPFTIQANAPTNTMRINQTGYVGIGTTTPNDYLEVSGGANDTRVSIDSTNRYRGVELNDAGNFKGGLFFDNTLDTIEIWDEKPGDVDFAAISIKDGNVGIGTSAPSAKLQVIDTDTAMSAYQESAQVGIMKIKTNAADSVSVVRIANDAKAWDIAVEGRAGQGDDFGINDNSGGGRRLTINGSGNVGIGTTSPAGKLDVNGDICLGGVCRTTWPTGSGVGAFTDTGSSAYYNGGRVGIGTSSPNRMLSISSDGSGSNRGIRIEATGATGYSELVFKSDTKDYRIGVGGSSVPDGSDEKFYIYSTTNGQSVVVDDAGRMGIANTSPQSTLHVGSSTKTGIMTIESPNNVSSDFNLLTKSDGVNGIGNAATKGWHFSARGDTLANTNEQNDLGMWFWDGTTFQPRMYYDNGGMVGINTATPTAELEISSSTYPRMTISSADAGNTDNTAFNLMTKGTQHNTAGNKNWHVYAGGDGRVDNQKNRMIFAFYDGVTPTETMTLGHDGNVGIGTTAPNTDLTIEKSVNGQVGIRNTNTSTGSSAYSIYRQYSDTGSLVMFTNSSTRTVDGGAGNTTVRTDSGNLHLSAAGGQKMSINTSGSVGIGTTSPLGGPGDLTLGNTGGSRGDLYLYGSTANAYGQVMTTNGNLHIDAGFGAGAVGEYIYLNWFSGARTVVGNGAGAHGIIEAANFTTVSDRRLKRDVEDLDSPLEKVLALRGVEYYFSKENYSDKKQIGFIAQEVRDIFPEVVDGNEDEGYLSVNYSMLVAPLVEATKEQQALIEKNKKLLSFMSTGLKETVEDHGRRIASLEEENTMIKSELSNMKSKLDGALNENEMLKTYLCQKDPQAPFCR